MKNKKISNIITTIIMVSALITAFTLLVIAILGIWGLINGALVFKITASATVLLLVDLAVIEILE